VVQPFIKTVLSDGYDFGEPSVRLVKVAHGGLRGHDLRAFVKRAGYHFAELVKKADLKPGDVAAHLLAMGATEYFGPNRNGDGFKEAMLREYHPTFAKFARAYRHHQNKDPERSYGYVKESVYNPDMHRVELLTIYNGTKEAAERNGGLVADEEVDALEGGKDFPVSMSIKVPYDLCSGCGNKAASRAEYCEDSRMGGHCKDGGLRHNIGRVVDNDENPLLHADNPEGVFFDISKVGRGADRTAFALGKVASGALPLGGAALAAHWDVSGPGHVLALGTPAGDEVEVGVKLAEFERDLPGHPWRLAFAPEVQPACDFSAPGGKVAQALSALAAARVSLPVEGFLTLVGVEPAKAAAHAGAVRAALPGVYTKLARSQKFAEILAANPFRPTETASRLVREWAQKLAAHYGVDPAAASERAARAAVREARAPGLRAAEKAAAPAAGELARTYGLYKLAFLHAARKAGACDLTLRLAVLQNYV
jgi:hypothetical protein